MVSFDHVAVCCASLESGAADLERKLGVPLEAGGKHPFMGTHNRLLRLGPGEYLELIAIDPAAPPPGRPRWFGLDRFAGDPRPTNWVVRVPDLGAALGLAPSGAGRATDLERGPYRWRMGVPDDGTLPFDEMFPALIEWQGAAHPADALPDRGCRLVGLELSLGDPAALAGRLPLDDPRIHVVAGAPRLSVTLATPAGEVVLS